MAQTKSGAVRGFGPIWKGRIGANAQLIDLMYGELHRLAERYMRRERSDHSLQSTPLVNEAYLRLMERRPKARQNRAHFFAVAAIVMRQIVDSARRRPALESGPRKRVAAVDDLVLHDSARPTIDRNQAKSVIAPDRVLTKLATFSPRQSRIVELRFFSGMSTKKTAETLSVSPWTVDREWSAAQAWLSDQLRSLS